MAGNNEIRFDGRVAIITGAGNGMGRAHAIALAARGASVVVNDLGGDVYGGGASKMVADAVVDEICVAGGRAVPSYASVGSAEGGMSIAQTALDAFGRIDILVNNAGIHRHAPFEQQTQEDIDKTWAVVLNGAIYVTQPVYKVMREAMYGRILFISSSAGFFGLPSTSIYSAAKAGVIGLMNTLSVEGAEFGILCNAILPGAITRGGLDSDLPDATRDVVARAWGAIKEGLRPEFVTPLVLFLISERCQATHSIFSAIGGRYALAFGGLTQGWQGPTDCPVGAEAVEQNFEKITRLQDFYIPRSAEDELKVLAQRSIPQQSPAS